MINRIFWVAFFSLSLAFGQYLPVLAAASPQSGKLSFGSSSAIFTLDTNLSLTTATGSNGGMLPIYKGEQLTNISEFPNIGDSDIDYNLRFFTQGGQADGDATTLWFKPSNTADQITSAGNMIYAIKVKVFFVGSIISPTAFNYTAEGAYIYFNSETNTLNEVVGNVVPTDDTSFRDYFRAINISSPVTSRTDVFYINETRLTAQGGTEITKIISGPLFGYDPDTGFDGDSACGKPSFKKIVKWIPCFIAEITYQMFYGIMGWDPPHKVGTAIPTPVPTPSPTPSPDPNPLPNPIPTPLFP